MSLRFGMGKLHIEIPPSYLPGLDTHASLKEVGSIKNLIPSLARVVPH